MNYKKCGLGTPEIMLVVAAHSCSGTKQEKVPSSFSEVCSSSSSSRQKL